MKDGQDQGSLRLDKWLWAARFFKTRRLATDAIAHGKVKVDGQKVKPARPVRMGMSVSVQKGPYTFDITVVALSEHRGPASIAQSLYSERQESEEKREQVRLQLRAQRDSRIVTDGRPDKHSRRRISEFKRKGDSDD